MFNSGEAQKNFLLLLWRNGQRVRLLIERLQVRVLPGVFSGGGGLDWLQQNIKLLKKVPDFPSFKYEKSQTPVRNPFFRGLGLESKVL